MIKYLYETQYNEDYNDVILDFGVDDSLENGYLISNSLGSDVFGDFDTVKDEIEKLLELLEGKVTLYEGGGNVNLIKSNKFFTTIEDIFTEEDEEDSICKIETLEFAKIILVWAKENFKYKYQRGIMLKEEAEIVVDWINNKCIVMNELEIG
ncbi:hypothetical protein [Paenibacillus xylanexedens]|uniref:hypothetical protein n=1 Tax=Paenibacillus xylanexedens TaxID=528191 RepID=UPI00119D399C|nr:hypothetical protein [Paenibacillus xylanexedens]